MRTDRAVLVFALTLCLASSAGLQAQNPSGGEIRINQQTAGVQWLPDVATAADGRFVVVWNQPGEDANFVTVRLFDAAGRPRSGDLRVAKVVKPAFGRPAVSMAPDGKFVVVWGGGVEDPNIAFGRRYAADGSPLGARFRLSRPTTISQGGPDVAVAADGSFIAVWSQDDGGISSEGTRTTDVFFRRFGADGRPLGPEAPAIAGYEEQSAPQVATANGRFVVVCQSYGAADGAFYGVEARLFASSGAPLGEPFLVNDDPYEVSQFEPAVAMAANGRFAVTWTDEAGDLDRSPNPGENDHRGVMARFYAADGIPLGPQRHVNTFLPGYQQTPAVSALPAGGFLVLWVSYPAQDGDRSGVFARTFGPAGNARGGEVRINVNGAGPHSYPAVAVAPNGKGVAAWTGPDGAESGISARLLRPRPGS
jgi:hypothetical protein